VRRSKCLPEGGGLTPEDLSGVDYALDGGAMPTV
jgi:hypothetical protein